MPRELPIVWTLHDMNPFTGGCHYSGDCGKFRESCGACPELQSTIQEDFSSESWEENSKLSSTEKDMEFRLLRQAIGWRSRRAAADCLAECRLK